MDYRDFLGAKEEHELPHLGGMRVAGPRPIRLERALPEGWYRFVLQGRKVSSTEPCEPDEELLESLPAVRGHLVGEHLALEDGSVRRLQLLPEWRPERFAPVLARAWGEGLVFHREDFEDEAESLVRQALDEGGGLDGVRGVPSSLRAAFALRLLEQASEATEIGWQIQEASPRLGRIASEGPACAEAWLREMDQLRQERLREEEQRRAQLAREAEREALVRARALALRLELEALGRLGRRSARWEGERLRAQLDALERRAWRLVPSPGLGPRRSRAARREQDLEQRIDRALHEAGGLLLELRPLGEGLVDVRWRLGDTRLLTMVRAETLQVVDSGVCLSGADDRVTLESLPGVILEAIRTGQLVITRRT